MYNAPLWWDDCVKKCCLCWVYRVTTWPCNEMAKFEILQFWTEIFSKTVTMIFVYFCTFLGCIFVSKIWKVRKFHNRILKEAELNKNIYHFYLPLGFGACKFCTLIVTRNIYMKIEFWAPTHIYVQCSFVTRWPCDKLSVSHR